MHIHRNIRAGLFLRAVYWKYIEGFKEYVSDIPKRLKHDRESKIVEKEELEKLDDALALLDNKFRRAIDAAFDADFGRQPVSNYFQALLKKLDLPGLRRLPYSEYIEHRVQALEKEFIAVNCLECGAHGGDYCKGFPSDGYFVREKGLCFRWFLDIVDYYNGVGMKYCSSVAQKYRLAGTQVLFETAHCNELRPHRFDHESDMNSCITFSDAGGIPSSNIRFTLSKYMRETTLAVAPYHILHEVMCHVFQKIALYQDGHCLEHRDRDVRCAFAEGWLAQVSYRIMMEQLVPSFDSLAPKYIQKVYGSIHLECQKFHEARMKIFQSGAHYANFFTYSFFACADMFGISPNDGAALSKIMDIAFEFAFLINAHASNDQIKRFIEVVDALAPSSEPFNDPASAWLWAPASEAAKQFLQEPNFDDLLCALEQIRIPLN